MNNRIAHILVLFLTINTIAKSSWSQSFNTISYTTPKSYVIGRIVVDGPRLISHDYIIQKSGLKEGQTINVPGQEITSALNKLWETNDFSDVQIIAEKIQGTTIYLVLKCVERERLGIRDDLIVFNEEVKKSEINSIKENLNLMPNMVISDELLNKVNRACRNYYTDKGYFKASATTKIHFDTIKGPQLRVKVTKGPRYKINSITIEGNEALTDVKIKRQMKETKEKHWYRIFWRSKFNQFNYSEDKQKIIDKYVDMAFRDAEITFDTIFDHDDKTINIVLHINEGNKYFIRSIEWVGNVKYRSTYLDTILGIKPGDEYNKKTMDMRLYMNPNGSDVSSLYMDQGYLFFQITPTEKNVSGDSVDLEFRIYEGKQARIKDVTVVGNTKTSDHVILRDLYTFPGDLFSRDAVIRSQRELSQKGYFNPETLGVNPMPNPADGTVNIEYTVEERPSDQIELSGGFGAGRVVGTLGVSFNNFSMKRFFKKGSWTPLPSGDGQRLSIRAQSNGYWFQSYNFSFTEPWLGGKRPNSFSFTAFRSSMSNNPWYLRDAQGKLIRDTDGNKIRFENRSFMNITGVAVGLGRRLKWPDDYFNFYQEVSFQYYELNNYGRIFSFADGTARNLSYRFAISRNSIDQPLYPRGGSELLFSFKTSIPYSYFDGVSDYSSFSEQELNKWLEYNKIKFTASWFSSVTKDKKLVVNARFGSAFLNRWNSALPVTPFERFYMGGSGLTGFNIDGREIIALRGYDDGNVSEQTGGRLITKYTLELRYPLSLNPSATIYMLGFAEAGNTWNNYKDFNPFMVKRSAGIGVRIFLPMFGLMGLDYGFGFDPVDPNALGAPNHNLEIQNKGYRGQFHFTIGMNLGEL
jgi:outer membrane protein insertion porin family